MKVVMKMLMVCAALAALVASPALAQSYAQVSANRSAAIHKCSAAASKYSEYTWGNMEFQQYKACMAISSQPE